MTKNKLTESLRIRRIRVRRAYAVSSLKTGNLCTPMTWGGISRDETRTLAIFPSYAEAVKWCGKGENYRIARVTVEEL